MKLRGVTSIRRIVSDVASRVDSLSLGGRVRVLSIMCQECERRVKPGDWNVRLGCCEVCAMYELHRGRAMLRKRRAAFGKSSTVDLMRG